MEKSRKQTNDKSVKKLVKLENNRVCDFSTLGSTLIYHECSWSCLLCQTTAESLQY